MRSRDNGVYSKAYGQCFSLSVSLQRFLLSTLFAMLVLAAACIETARADYLSVEDVESLIVLIRAEFILLDEEINKAEKDLSPSSPVKER